METKKEVFGRYGKEYWAAGRRRKKEILDRVSDVTGMHRKAAVRRFRKLQMRDPAKEDARGGKLVYGPDVTAALKTVWEAGNRVCGELLRLMVGEYVDIFLRDRMWKHEEVATILLRQMSEATMKRRIGNFTRIQRMRHGISSTKPSHLKHLVPIFTGPWQGKPPGYGQIDTVRHSNSAFGELHRCGDNDSDPPRPMEQDAGGDAKEYGRNQGPDAVLVARGASRHEIRVPESVRDRMVRNGEDRPLALTPQPQE